MTAAAATLDHVVVNTLRGMDAAAATFVQLGFALTPRGHHSLGSINHLMMTPGPYLELVGVPESGLQRQEVIDSPFGLNGLVLRSDDAAATQTRLCGAGFAAMPPASFSRPVTIEGAERDARFRTVRLPAEAFPAGRVYFCEHLTPDYVWRAEWLAHPNSFKNITEIVVASRDPASEAECYARVCDTAAERGTDGWQVRLGAFTIRLVEDGTPRLLSLGLRFTDLDLLLERARGLRDVTFVAGGSGSATLTLSALDLTFHCRSDA